MTLSVAAYVVCGMLLVAGTVMSASALVMLTTGHAVFNRGKPVARKKAREELSIGLKGTAIGANGIAIVSDLHTARWITFAVLIALIAWDVRSWVNSRRGRKRQHATAEQS